MAKILYGKKIVDKRGLGMGEAFLHELFFEAIFMNEKLVRAGMKVAYAFIDPLLKNFEAGNRFYFRVFKCGVIEKLNGYRTGAGPVHALHDARELVDAGLYDAVFVFGYEPLLSQKKHLGRQAVQGAMDILPGASIPQIYNGLGEILCREFGLSQEKFSFFADCLYDNYARTFSKRHPEDKLPGSRGRRLVEEGAPLFFLTDCANPNLDFAGGLLVGSDAVADLLGIPEKKRIPVRSVRQTMLEADPDTLETITGTGENPFPHLKEILDAAEKESGLDFVKEFSGKNLLLDVYTCYPPIPMGFLLAGGFIGEIGELPAFLEKSGITMTGGLSLAGAPWNNPVLRSLVLMWESLQESPARYGLVHGNGGIGEAQGIVVLERAEREKKV